MNTNEWLAAITALLFAGVLIIGIELLSIDQWILVAVTHSQKVQVENTGFNMTNYPPYSWKVERP